MKYPIDIHPTLYRYPAFFGQAGSHGHLACGQICHRADGYQLSASRSEH